jgi:hypothetical protein
MTTKTTQILLRTVAALVAILAIEAFYQLGYRNGTRDVLDADFSALVGNKIVCVGKGSSLLRSPRLADDGSTVTFTIERPITSPTNHP